MKLNISYKRFNPNYFHLRKAMKDSSIRNIFLQGGSSSAKTVSVVQAIVLDTIQTGDSTLILRKVGASISDTIYNDFKTEIKRFGLTCMYEVVQNLIRCSNGAVIRFKGLDDSEKIKGISSYKRVVMDELSEFDEEDYRQIGLRLRGIEGQQIICMFNPISETHWIKTKIFDKEKLNELPVYLDDISAYESKNGKIVKRFILSKEFTSISEKYINSSKTVWNDRLQDYEEHKPDTLILKSTYLNNFWVNGSPCGTYGYYDRQVIANFETLKNNNYTYYQIYALGDWGTIKTGGEFLPSFDLNKHVSECKYDNTLPIHISIDNNVLPYITATFYQVSGTNIKQIHEICAEEPNNTVTQAANMAVEYLNNFGYNDVVILYGDATTKAKNTIDDNKLSFFDKYKSIIEEHFVVSERVQSVNPSVSLSGEFVNEILSNNLVLQFNVDMSCTHSINDYANTKKDENGGMLKKRIKNKQTGQTYEELGHCTDCTRYFLTMCFNEEYNNFSNRRKRNKIQKDDILFYNVMPDNCDNKVFICPTLNNKYTYALISTFDNETFISEAYLSDEILNTDKLIEFIEKYKPIYIQIDSNSPEYLFSLRDKLSYNTEIIGKKIPNKIEDKINAHIPYINKFKFRYDYDTCNEYSNFIENMLDFKKGGNIEAIYLLSSISEYILLNK